MEDYDLPYAHLLKDQGVSDFFLKLYMYFKSSDASLPVAYILELVPLLPYDDHYYHHHHDNDSKDANNNACNPACTDRFCGRLVCGVLRNVWGGGHGRFLRPFVY